MSLISTTGKYFLLMKKVFVLPDRWKMFFRQFPKELEKLGLESLPIVIIYIGIYWSNPYYSKQN